MILSPIYPTGLSLVVKCMPFARFLSAGLALTWLVGTLLEVKSARAGELPPKAASVHAQISELHIAPAIGGWGAGPLLPTLTALVRHTPPISEGPASEQSGYYTLDGDINEDMRQRLEAALQKGRVKIQITSRGGEMLPARAMASMLNQADATLIVRGQCHSSCAYLWLATTSHRLGPGAHLALHSSYDANGLNDYGEHWLKDMGRADLAVWARSAELHHLTIEDLKF